MKCRINVIDPDVRRRANVAHQLMARGLHVEIFEDIAEFAEGGQIRGLVFISDDSVDPAEHRVRVIREATNAILLVVVYAEDPDAELVVEAMRAGAIDYLKWPFDGHRLETVFRRLENDKSLQIESLKSEAHAKVQSLSGREANVLALLVQGLPNKQMARNLSISPRTIEIHRANMMRKLGAQTTSDAIRIGLYAGIDEEPVPPKLIAHG